MLRELPYERGQALEYARRWALGRNPLFYNFTGQGGDCTNFISQCLLAGCLVMNCRETFGWYYHSPRLRAPAWTGVQYLWNFLSGNAGAGPYGREAELAEKTKRLKELNILLNMDEKDKTLMDDGPDEGEEMPERKVVGLER